MTTREWLICAQNRLRLLGIDSAGLESQLLASHVLGVERTWVIAHPESEFNDLAGETLLNRRESREPLAYILGWREFYGRRFEVGPGVLIPRQETETLLETVLQRALAGPFLDLGTGSGCLAISIKKERPEIEVWASDISERALQYAHRNAEVHEADVEFVRSDGFAEIGEARFELIVSNPPYIGNHEQLMPEVQDYEPSEALFSGPTGLEFFERLALQAPEFLRPNGKLAVEVGHTQAGDVVKLFAAHGWAADNVVTDLSGTDRVVVSTRPCESVLS